MSVMQTEGGSGGMMADDMAGRVISEPPRPRGDSFGSMNETVLPRRLEARPLRSLWERQMALLVLCAGTLVIILDTSVVNVALPSIQKDLGFSQSGLSWVVNAYLIPFGGLLLFAGRLGDLVGAKRVFIGGLALFTAASAACGLASSQEVLVAARFVQGIGGAFATAVVLGLLVTLFPKPREQVRALGVYGFVAAAGAAIGLLAGAALTQAINWHWIFYVNLPVGLVAIVFSIRLLDNVREVDKKGADVLGAVLITGSLMLLVYTIIQALDHGWTSARTLGLGGAALVLLGGFVAWQARARNPLVPLSIFRARNVSWSNLVQALMVAGLAGMFFLGALYLQQVMGFSAIKVGLAFLPTAVAVATVSLKVTPRLINHVDAKTVLIPGLVLMIAGLALFARVPVDGRYLVDVLPVMLLLGIGAGLCVPSVLTVAMADATTTDTGLRSGLVNTTQQVGPALGLAVLATLSTSRTEHTLAQGQSVASALTSGFHLAFLVGAGILLAALIVTVTLIKPAVPDTVPNALDPTSVNGGGKGIPRHNDLTGTLDPDFLALGVGGTNTMAMLWSVAMGRRTVGVELRGDPFVSVMHWNIREELYHHLGIIDQMMLERYGEDGVPRLGDGKLFRLSDCLYRSDTAAESVRTDEILTGFTPDAHIGGVLRYDEIVDDRWVDGAPQRVVTRLSGAERPGKPDPAQIGGNMVDVLDRKSTFQAGAEELLILLRRYLEAVERMDLERGVEPRVRLFTYHRVVTTDDNESSGRWSKLFSRRNRDSDGFVHLADGRKRIRIEAVRELDEKDRFRRERVQGTEVIDIGVPELFMIAEGLNSPDAERLGFRQHLVKVDRQDGRGPVVAQTDYLTGNVELFLDSRFRRRIASEFDSEGNEYWVHQVGIGHEDDSEIGWIQVEVPDFKTFDPILAGLVPARTDRGSKEYFAGYQFLIRDYYLEQVSYITEIPRNEILRTQLAYGPKLFSIVEKIGHDALVAANGVVGGDSFGNGHYITSGGVMTGMIGHGSRVLRYWQARDAGVGPDAAIRQLADGVKEDTEAWLQVSEKEFTQAPPFARNAEFQRASARAKRRRLNRHAKLIDATRRHRRSIVPLEHPDEWSRFVLHTGHLYAYVIPPLQDTHPAARTSMPRVDSVARNAPRVDDGSEMMAGTEMMADTGMMDGDVRTEVTVGGVHN